MIKRMLKAVARRVLWVFSLLLPIKKNRILFCSFYGRGYGDNPKYICEALRNKGYDLLWLVKNEQEAKSLPSEVKGVKYGFRAIFYIATSAVWVNNCRSEFIFKKKKQLYIQTWHGGGAQKRCEADVIDKLSRSYLKMAKRDSAHTDIMISESRFMTNLYHKSFWYNGYVLECGYPRYDILLDDTSKYKKKVCDYFNLSEDNEFVLYAPTFRADHSFKSYNVDFDRVIKALEKRFNKEYIMLVHLHPNVASIEGGITYNDSVINSTFYPDMQELIAASAVLIGDYSSVNYDFCLKKQPVFRFVSDLDEYLNDRDTYFSFGEYPYPYAKNNDELEGLILNFNEESYNADLMAFFEKLGARINSGSSMQIANLIDEYLATKNKKKLFLKCSNVLKGCK